MFLAVMPPRKFSKDEFFHAAYACEPWLKYFEGRYGFLIASLILSGVSGSWNSLAPTAS